MIESPNCFFINLKTGDRLYVMIDEENKTIYETIIDETGCYETTVDYDDLSEYSNQLVRAAADAGMVLHL